VTSASRPCGPTTTVQPGDTYFQIAQRCDVSVDMLREANPGVDQNDLQVGQTLQLTAEAPPQPEPAEPAPGDQYRVQPGDTVQSIAAALGVTVEALIAANPDIDPAALRVGQMLLPPAPGAPAEPPHGTRVSGVLTAEGIECQAMRGQDGQLYTLIGDLEGYGSGDAVQVRGPEPEVDFCQQGVTIEVEDIRGVG
jgi:LysM repeat protein